MGADEPEHRLLFRAIPPELGDRIEDIDALNKRILQHVQISGDSFLSGTVLNERFWLRACVVNPLAATTDIDAVFDAVLTARREVLH